MYAFLKQAIDRFSSLPATEFEGKTRSFAKLGNDIKATANSLVALGIKRGDIIVGVMPNLPQAVDLLYGANAIGATVSFLHPLASPSEIANALRQTEAKAVFVLDMFQEKIREAISEAGIDCPVVLLYASDALPLLKKLLYRMKEQKPIFDLTWAEFLKKGVTIEAPIDLGDGHGDDIATILYSGGTSGEPKGVMLTNRNFNALSIQSYDTMGIPDVSGMKVLAILPVFHGTGIGICIHSMLCNGIRSILIPNFDRKKCCRLIFKKRIEFLFGVPGFYEALSRSPEIEKHSCSFISVIGSCGDFLPDQTRKRMDKYLRASGAPCTLTNGYGLTESTAGVCYEPYFGKKPGTSGMMVPDMLAKIVKPGTEEDVPVGAPGELCISGPTVMAGYFKNPHATEKALFVDKAGRTWLRTGDCFSIDEEGYLTYIQRLDRMFVSSGFNIYPSTIERVIASVPGVMQCCVVGKALPAVGKKPVAYVIAPSSLQDRIRAEVSKMVPEYAWPLNYEFVNELPKTKMGKIDYRQLEIQSTGITE